MSRSGYSDDCGGWALIRWRGAVSSAIRGKRGQAFLRELALALDSLPEKRLGANSLMSADGEYCALGAVGRARGISLAEIDPDDRDEVAKAFGISEALAAEIMYFNDESSASDWIVTEIELPGPVRPGYPDFGRLMHRELVRNPRSGEARWQYMHRWVSSHLKAAS